MPLRGNIQMLAIGASICMFGTQQQLANAQHQPTPKEQANIANNAARHFGDAPDNPGPIATDLSYSTKPAAAGKAMRKVADAERAGEHCQQRGASFWRRPG